MLAIRMQRTGRKGHAMFRVVVQDSRRTPTSGKVVAQLGSYDPHTKTATLDGEKASFYLKNGAQPSDRAALLLKKEGVKLPDWAVSSATKKRDIRNPEKLRRNRPAEEPAKAKEPEAAAEPEEAAEPEQAVAEPETATEPETVAAADTETPAAEEKPADTPEA